MLRLCAHGLILGRLHRTSDVPTDTGTALSSGQCLSSRIIADRAAAAIPMPLGCSKPALVRSCRRNRGHCRGSLSRFRSDRAASRRVGCSQDGAQTRMIGQPASVIKVKECLAYQRACVVDSLCGIHKEHSEPTVSHCATGMPNSRLNASR